VIGLGARGEHGAEANVVQHGPVGGYGVGNRFTREAHNRVRA
jgi:hypothetical protein